MGRKVRPPVERHGSQFSINIPRDERELIRRLMGEMRIVLTDAERDDGRLQRIFPAAYHQSGDQEFNAEYQRLMRDELLSSRLRGLDAVDSFMQRASGDRAVLTEDEMMAFLQALNGVRLVLGTMLDISEEHDIGMVDDTDPLVGEYNLYDFLSWLLDWSVRAVAMS